MQKQYNMYVCDLLQVFVRVPGGMGAYAVCVVCWVEVGGGALLFLVEVAETALLRLRRGFIPLEGCRLSSSCSVK